MERPQFLAENRRLVTWSGRPEPPRSLIAQGGSFEIRVSWLQPVDPRGVDGFRVYQDDEDNLIWQTKDRNARQYVGTGVKADTDTAFYVSCISLNGRESPKVQVIGKANTDSLVTSGTGGATNGTSTSPPPDYTKEPAGGRRQSLYEL